MAARKPNVTSGSKAHNWMQPPKTKQGAPTATPGVATAEDLKTLPILRNPRKEAYVVTHVIERLKLAEEERDRRADRNEAIDKQLSGYIQLDPEDRVRRKDNKAGKAPVPTKINLTLTLAQLEEAVTFLMSVYAPEMNLFEAAAPGDKQQMAKAVVGEFNRQGQRGQYYRHVAKFCNNALKYNLSALSCFWEKHTGIVFKGNPGGQVEKTEGNVFEGNVLNCMNMYNFFYDTSVENPVDLPKEGEYYGWVERKTPFRIRKLAQNKQLFGTERYINEIFDANTSTSIPGGKGGKSFYRVPPTVRDDDGTSSGKVNWSSTIRGVDSKAKDSIAGVELAHFIGWINPKELGLGPDDALQLWYLKIANAKYLTFAAELQDNHGLLPIVVSVPNEDDLGTEQRSHAEQLIPLQHFGSFLLNSHVKGTRKGIYGINVYNKELFPGLDKDEQELTAAMIPMRGSAAGTDIDKAFRHYNTTPNTDQNVAMLEQINAIMQKILPTDMLKQVADLERATTYQAAATVQGANRRNLKIACMISDQALNLLKFMMAYNLYANLPTITYIDDVTGQRTELSVDKLVENYIEYELGTGLKGFDRLMVVVILRDVVNAILQSQQAIQEIDIVRLLNYVTSLAGDRTDLVQFRRQPPQPGQQAQPGQGQTAPPNPPGQQIAKP